MAQILHLNIPEYEENQEEMASHNVCICCLSRTESFIKLTNCKHSNFLSDIFLKDMKPSDFLVCKYCHVFLKKIHQFKRQILINIDIMTDPIQDLNITRIPRDIKLNEALLSSQHTTESLTVKPIITSFISLSVKENNSLDDIVVVHGEPKPLNEQTSLDKQKAANHDDDRRTNQSADVVITDLKVERDDDEWWTGADEPLSSYKKGRKKKKKIVIKETVDNEEDATVDNIYEGKICIVMLSREEMLLERENARKDKAYLKLHYKCEDCIVGFDHEVNLKGHMERKHTPKPGGYKCEICKSVMKNEVSFKEHAKRHIKRFCCMECGRRYCTLVVATGHYNDMHSGQFGEERQCKECPFKTRNHRQYRYHVSRHRSRQHCEMCEKRFVNRAGLKAHMLTVHKLSSRVYTCDICFKVYTYKSGLSAHTRSAHSTTSAAYCAPCDTHFRTDTILKQHLRTHSAHLQHEEKRLICDECGRRYVRKLDLVQHINYCHLRTDDFKCQHCEKTFMNNSKLKKHVLYVHEKKRPPRDKVCHHCGKAFYSNQLLTTHIRTHTGERPIRCDHCPATFAHKAARYNHRRLVHKIGKLERNS